MNIGCNTEEPCYRAACYRCITVPKPETRQEHHTYCRNEDCEFCQDHYRTCQDHGCRMCDNVDSIELHVFNYHDDVTKMSVRGRDKYEWWMSGDARKMYEQRVEETLQLSDELRNYIITKGPYCFTLDDPIEIPKDCISKDKKHPGIFDVVYRDCFYTVLEFIGNEEGVNQYNSWTYSELEDNEIVAEGQLWSSPTNNNEYYRNGFWNEFSYIASSADDDNRHCFYRKGMETGQVFCIKDDIVSIQWCYAGKDVPSAMVQRFVEGILYSVWEFPHEIARFIWGFLDNNVIP